MPIYTQAYKGGEIVMAVVVNNPSESDRSGGMGFFLGILLLVVVVFLFFMYGLPALNQVARNSTGGGTQINVPDKINVDVQNPQPQ